ncbi:Tim44/TimA family putative adaptor protein [Neokomagataea thailandica]|uniref:Mitochondrial import inner membrane translocase subunit Tim44 n=1 Tax=Neokomagataea tanensis NBRC 106556 TaxID=1223519 RepID=A0ABQ0QJD3_9PROT|nr:MULTISPECIES: Tim44/TimA family putative adaptor protein [Neokomagataea]GBR46874.1 mitochondrial import inner membrane translocase subunit Tim44 [Neokomagataea tanensis NBRC 106556]
MSSDTFHFPSFLTSQGGHSFPWDVVILAVIAAALAFRLYRILGRRVGVQGVKQAMSRPMAAPAGTERTVPPPLPEGAGVGSGAEPMRARYEIPAPATRVGGVLVDLVKMRSGFNPQEFLQGVEMSFRKVVSAYAQGDRATLATVMTDDVAQVFNNAITEREAAKQTQRSELRGVDVLSIQDATIVSVDNAPVARIEVNIISRQINALMGENGQLVVGTEAVTEFHDLWLFETSLGSDDTRWRLAASRPA